jgi:hypothetical protein
MLPYNRPPRAQRGSEGIALLILNIGARRGVGGQHQAPAALPPAKTRYSLYRRMGGPQGRSGHVRKIPPPPGFDIRTVQPRSSVAIPTELPGPHTDINRYLQNKPLLGSLNYWDGCSLSCMG